MTRSRGVLLGVGAGVVVLLAWLVATSTYAVQASRSMEPWAPPGSLLVHRTVPATELVAGDVITVRTTNAQLVTHRITTLDRSDAGTLAATLAGDRAGVLEDVALSEDVARVVLVVPRLGTVVTTSAPLLVAGLGLLGVGALALTVRSEPRAADAPTTGPDPRVSALVASCEDLHHRGTPAVVIADLVRVRTAALVGLPAAEQTSAAGGLDAGARFYLEALAAMDTGALALVPPASRRRRATTAALDRWWHDQREHVPRSTLAAIRPWTID